MTCNHEWSEKDIAVDADGFCPLCQAAEVERLLTLVGQGIQIEHALRVEIERLMAVISQIGKVCDDNAADTCNHAMALSFVSSIVRGEKKILAQRIRRIQAYEDLGM